VSDDDPTGWFEPLYAAAERGEREVPWDRDEPRDLLVEWVERRGLDGSGIGALVIGAGFGADAEYLSSLGFDVTAFDVAPTAVRAAQERHPGSSVDYVVADLLEPPQAWAEAFAFVFEALTVQALPESVRSRAIARVGAFVAPRGTLLVVAAARDEADGPADGPPWPLTRAELDSFARGGLEGVEVEALAGPRWRAEFRRP
jgi:SAM-dependent methyltransferase